MATLLFGCANSTEARETPEPPATVIERAPRHLLRAAEDASGAGSTVLVAWLDGRRLVFVADEDEADITVIDPDGRAEIGRTSVGGRPAQMVVASDGRLYVALREQHEIAVLEPTGRTDGSLVFRHRISTAAEPLALAAAPDGDTLFVASGWGQKLEAFSLRTRDRTFAVDLPREPRSVTLSEDGRTAFVSHMALGFMSVVNVASEHPTASRISLEGGDITPPPMCPLPGQDPNAHESRRSAVQGFASVRFEGRVLVPQTLVRTGDPQTRSDGYGNLLGDLPSHVFDVAVVDAASRRPAYSSVHVQTLDVARHVRGVRDCLLPRAAAADARRGSILVACVDIHAVVEVDARAPDPARAEKRRYAVAAGPTGVAVDGAAREAFAWSQFGRVLNILPLGDAKDARRDAGSYRTIRVPLGQSSFEDWNARLGRSLFHASGDKRIAKDGRACASCHPDGRDDGLTWPTPNGPRQPPMLAGRAAGTAPYGWLGAHANMKDHLATTFKRLGGKGLDATSLDALIGYVEWMPAPPRPQRPLDAALVRGRELFHDAGVGCAECHRESRGWSDAKNHDVASRAAADTFSKFNTPSLRFVGGTAPYFHDGRYPTLRALLAATDGVMGNTGHLGEEDKDALVAYVESL